MKGDSHAASVAALKKSGLYRQRDPSDVRAESEAAQKDRNVAASRRRVRTKLAATAAVRWERWLTRARAGLAQWGSPPFYEMEMVERLAGQLGQALPADLLAFAGNWRERQAAKAAQRREPGRIPRTGKNSPKASSPITPAADRLPVNPV